MKFKDKVVLITGAASGIGHAQAKSFLEEGARVLAIDIDERGLEELASSYPKFTYELCSVVDKKKIQHFLRDQLNKYKKIDVLLNTAGKLDAYASSLKTSELLWDEIMETNVKGMYIVTNEVLPYMLQAGEGVIINMASIAGLVPGGGGAAYTASKHAVIGYTKQLAYDYSKQGIRINAIAPGAIRTPMNEKDFLGDGLMAKWVAEETPAGRWAQPEEVAALTLFLASEQASYIHSTVIPIDGGWLNRA